MRTVTIEKDGNNYVVNPKASGGGDTTVYAWIEGYGRVHYTSFDIAPEQDAAENEFMLDMDDSETGILVRELLYDAPGYGIEYTKISDTEFSLVNEAEGRTFTRDSTKDFTLWQLSQ